MRRGVTVVACAAAALFLAVCSPAFASTIEPNTTADTVADDGQCSLREAITAAFTHTPSGTMAGECVAGDGNDTVKLGPGQFVLSRGPLSNENANDSGDLDIRSSLTLQGAGAAATTIDANMRDRAIEVRNDATVTIAGVTITRGRPPGLLVPGAGADGGGIFNNTTRTLTVRDSVVTLNRAGTGGPGLLGTSSNGTNGANGNPTGETGGSPGPGVGDPGGFGGAGGGIASNGPLIVERSTISENVAGTGGTGGRALPGNAGNGGNGTTTGGAGGTGGNATGGVGGPGGPGGGISSQGHVTLADSTLTLNAGGTGGEGGQSFGGVGGNGGNAQPGGTGGNGGNGGTATGGQGGTGGVAGGLNAAAGADITGATVDHNTAGTGGTGGPAVAGKSSDGGSAAGHGGQGGAATGGLGGTGGRFAGLNLIGPSSVTNTTVTAQAGGPGGMGGDATGGDGGNGDGANGGTGGAATGGSGNAGGGSVGITGFDPAFTLTHVTVSANVVGSGGTPGQATPGAGGSPNGATGPTAAGASGTAGQLAGLDGTPRLANSIVAGNLGGNCAPTVVDGGHNVAFGDATCPGLHGDPLLGQLQDNGGPTLTQSIGPASAARDIVPANGAQCAPVDQRGVARPQGPACDAGAFERPAVLGTPPPPVDRTPPRFLTASLAPTRFAVGARAARRQANRGTTFRYTLSEAAQVVFTFERRATGRRVGARCVTPSRKTRRSRRCTRFIRAGRFASASPAGVTRERFSGRVGRVTLRPGNYRVTLVATDAAGNASQPARLRFTVLSH